jgi:hypothetical protein
MERAMGIEPRPKLVKCRAFSTFMTQVEGKTRVSKRIQPGRNGIAHKPITHQVTVLK